jgi:hypothetical protein
MLCSIAALGQTVSAFGALFLVIVIGSSTARLALDRVQFALKRLINKDFEREYKFDCGLISIAVTAFALFQFGKNWFSNIGADYKLT